jgi:selenocysteine-specific elongation factor
VLGEQQLEREGRLVRLGDGLAIAPAAYEHARAALVAECERAGTISLARFRDLLGASRRVAQLLLERLDADRVTIRIGDARRLRRSATRR